MIRSARWLGAACCLWMIAGVAHAQPTPLPTPAPVMPSDVPAKVEIHVQIIHADNDGTGIDPQLADLKATLARLPYNSFSLVDESTYKLADGTAVELSVSTKHIVRLQLTSHNSTDARVEVTYTHEDQEPVDTQLSIKRDRAFLSVLRAGTDHALLLKIDVRY